MNILIEILILALFCNGLYIASEDHMILERPNRWMEKSLPLWIYKPVLGCIYCMASIWGVVVYFVVNGTTTDLYHLPILIICGCFANGLVRTIYDLIYNKAYTKRTEFDFRPHEGQDN